MAAVKQKSKMKVGRERERKIFGGFLVMQAILVMNHGSLGGHWISDKTQCEQEKTPKKSEQV